MSDDQLDALLARVGLKADDLEDDLLEVARSHVTEERTVQTPTELIAAGYASNGQADIAQRRRHADETRVAAAGLNNPGEHPMAVLAARVASGEIDVNTLTPQQRFSLGFYQRALEAQDTLGDSK